MMAMVTAHLWQSTLFASVAGLLTLALRKNRARARYWVWLAGLVKFLVPFAALVSLGSHLTLPRWNPQASTQAQALTGRAISFVTGEVAQPFFTAATAVPNSGRDLLPMILLGVWACGFVAIAFRWHRRYTNVRADMRLASRLPIEIAIPVLSSPTMREPGVFGIFRPVLLLPEGMAEHLTKEEWGAILAHEMCHVRCYDNLTAVIYMLVESAFWFHPLVWWMGTRLVAERERACDEEVLRLGSDPKVYAEGILKVCERYLESPLACVAGVTGSNLRRRIRAIMSNRPAERMTMAKKLALAAVGIAVSGMPIVEGILRAQDISTQAHAAAIPKWEVVSIRPCEPGPPVEGIRSGGMGVSPGRLHVTCVSLNFLVVAAYATFADSYVSDDIAGEPAWAKSDRYNIEAKTDGNPSAQMMQGPMLQALLEDRFKLRIRRETREVLVYNLSVAKSGFKLQPMKEGSCAPFDFLNAGTNAAADLKGTLEKLSKSCDRVGFSATSQGTRTAEFHGVDFNSVAKHLSRVASGLGRPVINKTNIAGIFDFQFEFSPEQMAAAGDSPPDPSGAPSIFTAIQQVAGLKLEPTKGPGDFLVVDSAERPSEN